MDLSVIIVNFKSRDKAMKCVKAVKDAETSGLSMEIILVDNDSRDGSGADLVKTYPDLIFIQNQRNAGMGAGNNIGIRKARGEFILVLNPDTYVKPDAIRILLDFMRLDERTGIAGPRISYPDGQPQLTCFELPPVYMPILRRTFLGSFFRQKLKSYLMADYDHESPREVGWLMGSALMIRKKMLDRIGAFDERFFMYFEDTDLCRRAAQAGWKVVYYPGAQAVHDHSRASARGIWWKSIFSNRMARAHISSWIRYFWKWGIGRQ